MTPLIDGKQFQKIMLAGANRVISKQEELNKLNVFPVPDGDTGSNMACTFSSIVREIDINVPHDTMLNISTLADKFADAAINGAHGNSGSITAEFFQGLSEGLQGHATLSLEHFALAGNMAANKARLAIENPVKGTIITVMHEWGEWLIENWQKYNDFQPLFSAALEIAQTALAATTSQLKVLSQNHVVDAGAQGFVHFLEGINDFLMIGHIDDLSVMKQTETASATAHAHAEGAHTAETRIEPHKNDVSTVENLVNQFCTECIMSGKHLDPAKIRAEMTRWGDSMVVIGNSHKVKVHIHTNAPQKVFRKANEFGEVLETKAEDMWAQYRAAIGWEHNKKIAIITDTSCSLPLEFLVKYNIIIIPLQVVVNNQSYLDKVNISQQQFLDYLRDAQNNISTSQASIPDMKAAIEKALGQSDAAIIVPISSGLSGTFKSLQKVAERYEEENISVIDSKNAAGGQGLVVRAAALAAHSGKSVENVIEITKKTADNVKQFMSVATMKYAIKGGRVKRSTGTISTLLRLMPVLHFDHAGKIVKHSLAFSVLLGRRRMLNLAIVEAKKLRHPVFLISHVEAENAAKKMAARLQKQFSLAEAPEVIETAPTIATHCGKGTLSISVVEDYSR